MPDILQYDKSDCNLISILSLCRYLQTQMGVNAFQLFWESEGSSLESFTYLVIPSGLLNLKSALSDDDINNLPIFCENITVEQLNELASDGDLCATPKDASMLTVLDTVLKISLVAMGDAILGHF